MGREWRVGKKWKPRAPSEENPIAKLYIQNLIIQQIGIDNHLAANQVLYVDIRVGGIFETHHVRVAGGQPWK